MTAVSACISSGRPRPVREAAFQTIRRAILAGELAPGTRLVERTLATGMGVSRTPVREALRRLELEGLIRPGPGRTLVVAEPSADALPDIRRALAALESLLVELAATRSAPHDLVRLQALRLAAERSLRGEGRGAGRLADRIDQTVADVARSPFLAHLVGILRAEVARKSAPASAADPRALLGERRALLAALAARDVDGARRSVANRTAIG